MIGLILNPPGPPPPNRDAAPGGDDFVPETGTFGMLLLIASLTMFFAAGLIGYLVVRYQAGEWPPLGSPKLPRGLWLATGFIIASSATMQWSLNAIRGNRTDAFRRGIVVTLALAFGFLAVQFFNWYVMLYEKFTAASGLYGFTFYVLTGLHALHVIGGIVPMTLVTARGMMNRYSGRNFLGVRYCAMYWHFLGAVWLVLFGALYLLK